MKCILYRGEGADVVKKKSNHKEQEEGGAKDAKPILLLETLSTCFFIFAL